jgi:hypothetical protein
MWEEPKEEFMTPNHKALPLPLTKRGAIRRDDRNKVVFSLLVEVGERLFYNELN